MKDNSTGKNKDFYDLGKRMFDRIRVLPEHQAVPQSIPQIPQKDSSNRKLPVAWMVYTQDGQSVYVTDNPTDIQEGQRALPLYTGEE